MPVHVPSRDPAGDRADEGFEARRVVARALRGVVADVDVGDIDRQLPLRDEAGLTAADLVAVVGRIADETGVVIPADVGCGHASLDDLARALVAVERGEVVAGEHGGGAPGTTSDV
jgi:hypothetical protein